METNNKPLNGKSVYLSGPIEFDETNINWRPEVKSTLTLRFGIKIFDPFDDPKQSKSGELQIARKAGDFDKLAEIAADFVSKDLTEVDNANILIANMPYKVPTVGTIHEIINAVNRKIPTLVVCSKGKEFMSSWLYGIMKNKHKWYLHGSWDSLYSYLEEVNEGKHTWDRRWRYVYGLI
jgi:nucleoside 2-deoxyribosyltransferase